MTSMIGQSIGRYHILEQLGEGGMATVYKAYDTRLERDVAIKIIRMDLFGQTILKTILKRFEREAKALAKLSHPNIVSLIDYGEHEGIPYLVMVYLPGGTLKEKLGRQIPWADAARLLLPVAHALAYAHHEGVIHRDVKPNNILMARSGDPMLTDFGIAKILEIGESQSLTGSGVGIGTPEYMAPEQALGENVDARVDVYALGIIFYEMITGKKPFTADTPMAVVLKHINDPLPHPSEFVPNLPEAVEHVLFKALAKKPEDRYAEMDNMVAALEGLFAGQSLIDREAAEKAAPVQIGKKEPAWYRRIKPTPAILLVISILLIGLIGILPWKNWLAAARTSVTPTSAASLPLATTPVPLLTPTESATSFSTEISPKDGMVQVYVPAGEFLMGSADSDPAASGDEKPQQSVYLDAFWIDQTEVTNSMYARCVQAGACQPPDSQKGTDHYGNPQYDNHPVVHVTWDDAQSYCTWVGRILPTEAEWEKAARGTDGRIYPWGNQTPDASLLNFDTGNTTEVGHYPAGTSPYGALDMAGNVWEWTSSLYRPYPYKADDGREDLLSRGTRVLRSGSYGSRLESPGDVRAAYRNGGGDDSLPDSQSPSLGFRCACRLPPEPTATPQPPTPTLSVVAMQVSPNDGMVQVFVPAGKFLMGSTDSDPEAGSDEKPQHTVLLNAYWIDQTEVTNAMYAMCVQAKACQPPVSTGRSYYGDPQWDDYPVVYVSWDEAQTYCNWAGRRLPTEAEWEKEARGTDGRKYPWGDAKPDQNLLNFNWNVKDITRVGLYPAGASPYGALDMAGNVWEWVADWYDKTFYAGAPSQNPSGPSAGEYRVLRGGNWSSRSDNVRAASRFSDLPDSRYDYLGFRCAGSP
jgi:formylglycine-generating enzyme required for sulfatase activity/tRNA A-37 threonylcarbamoyl transferase component Bud32